MQDGTHQILPHQELARLDRLFMGSRFTVEGQLQGAHRSPQKGFSIEFADYRQYVPGDDLRHLDWRVYARNDRLYIRQYEEECRLRVFLLVDGSASMGYQYGEISKYAYAAKLAGALAYVTVKQQDAVGLTIFSQASEVQLPARSGATHLRILANHLAAHQPRQKTDLAGTIHGLVSRVQRRALFIIMSDLFDDLAALRRALAHFHRKHHDVVLYHVLDRAEIEFPFRETGQFRDLENGRTIITSPASIRQAYQERFSAFLEEVQGMAAGLDIDYILATSDIPPVSFIRRHLNRRQGKRG